MRPLIMIVFLTGIVIRGAAQDEEQPLTDPKVQSRIDAAKAAYITERLKLSPEEAEKFWPIYKEFADKRKVLRQQYRESKSTQTDDQAVVDHQLKLKQQELDLEKEYSGRFLKVISAQKVMHLRNAERDFAKIIIRQIQQRQMQQERRQQLRDRNQQRLQQRNN